MADLSKLKRRSTLGAPPPLTEASGNLDAPETAPQAPVASAPPPRAAPPQPQDGAGEHDGRSARRTGRTVQFATRVSSEFNEQLRAVAKRDGLLLVELLERALRSYETQAKREEEGAI